MSPYTLNPHSCVTIDFDLLGELPAVYLESEKSGFWFVVPLFAGTMGKLDAGLVLLSPYDVKTRVSRRQNAVGECVLGGGK
jgi:hypothetical protein